MSIIPTAVSDTSLSKPARRFQVVYVGHGEYAVVDTVVPEDGRPYTMCSGYRGDGAEEYADAARDALNSPPGGARPPDPIWCRVTT
jgi:hypothetical protein